MTGRHAAPLSEETNGVFPTRPLTPQAAWHARLPAPLPPVLGLIAGILLGFGSAWWPLAALLGVGLALAGRRWWLLPLVLAAGGLGFVREQGWEHAPDPLERYIGGQLTLEGHWDGQFLSLQDPPARVALSPKPASPPGELRVSGVLVSPPGVRIPGGFDYRFWLRAQGVHELLAGAAVKSSFPEGGVRGWFRRGLAAGLNGEQAALMTAVQLGDKNGLAGLDAQAAAAGSGALPDPVGKRGPAGRLRPRGIGAPDGAERTERGAAHRGAELPVHPHAAGPHRSWGATP